MKTHAQPIASSRYYHLSTTEIQTLENKSGAQIAREKLDNLFKN